jgi:sporulation protein YlmC with PRC-barrel domain
MRLYASEAALGTQAYEGVQDSWTDIGEVNDLILGQDGTVQAVLIDIGGFLGLGERQVAVQMPSIRFVQDAATADNDGDFFLVLAANRAALEGAPIYGRDGGVEGMTPGAAATGTGSAPRAPILRDGYAAVERDALTSKTLTGAEVYDAQDKRIGDVSELVLTPDGQVSEAVLDVGGFLGIGSKRVALPIAEVDILQSQDGGQVRVYVPHTREQLEAMSDYEG